VLRFRRLGSNWLRVRYTAAGVPHVTPQFRVRVVGDGRLLAQSTFAGAAALAQQSPLSPTALREQVTSKGGTTFAAITSLDDSGVKAAFVKALHAARDRATELGRA